jgi:hypothetical protein
MPFQWASHYLQSVLAGSDNDGYESDFLVLGLSPEVYQSISGPNIIPKKKLWY